jgi:hypothetical protein
LRGGLTGSGRSPATTSALIAVVCCASVPAIGVVVGGMTVAAVTGIAGVLLVVVAALAGALPALRTRRRRGSPPEEVAR